MDKKDDLPAMPFYYGDWRKDPGIRALKLDVRMIWFEMIGFMWESTERGFLTINGEPLDEDDLSRMIGIDMETMRSAIKQMEKFRVFRRRIDGAIYCRKMVKDEQIRQARSEAGKKGMYARYNKNDNKQTTNILTNPESENESESESESELEIKPEWAKNFENFDADIMYPFEYPEFAKIWDLWIAYRREKRLSKYKLIGQQAALNHLAELSGRDIHIADKIIIQSISNNWQGLFELKNNINDKTKDNKRSDPGEALKQGTYGDL